MVPFWLFSVVTISLMALLFIVSYWHFIKNPLPVPDFGNSIFVCSSSKSRDVLLKALSCFGIKPDREMNSRFVQRAFFLNRHRFIVNFTDPDEWSRLGKPVAGLAIVVRTPAKSAQKIEQLLKEDGHDVVLTIDPDPDLPIGCLAILTSSAFPGIALAFRCHLRKMGPRPAKWKDKNDL